MQPPGTPERWKRVAGAASLAALLAAVALPLAFLPLLAGPGVAPLALLGDPYLLAILRFTVLQAALSTLLSVGLALPLALALHRARFPGREAVLRLFLLPQALPTLVAALGILAVFGRGGAISDALVAFGRERLNIYGLPGILLAHVFFNMPLAARLMVARLSSVPAESWKLAGQLSLTGTQTFRIVEWPALRGAVPAAAGLVFMLCVTSFSLVLVLGGGPSATTLEVAIYQALRYDFEPSRAAALALLQVALVALALVPTLLVRSETGGFSLGALPRRFDAASPPRRAAEAAIVALALLFVLSPFAAILLDGLAADLPRLLGEPAVRRAIGTSLLVALASSTLALLLSLGIGFASQTLGGGGIARRGARLGLDLSASLVLVVPPIVIGAGWFLFLRRFGPPASFAPFVVVAANTAIAVPFMLRILAPEIAAANARLARLAASLDLKGTARLRHVELPALGRPAALAFALGLALSLGDLGAVALFGNQDFVTLPYLLLQRFGSYRSSDAQGLALILAVLCLVLMTLAQLGTLRNAPARGNVR